MSDLVIGDHNYQDHLYPVINGERKEMGLIPRDFGANPFGSLSFAKPFDLPLIPESEWADRLAAQKAAKATLMDIRDRGMNGQPIPSRDQDGYGYCWCHSTCSAILLARAAANQPYADLSAFAVGCMIKNYRNQGGWGGESVQFAAEKGYPTSKYWPQKSTSRSNDNPDTWADAAKHKVTEWMDLDPSQMKAQLVTCLLLNIPVVVDYNWWSHSVCAAALESLDPFTIWIWNSWTDDWGTRGMGKLQGRKAIPNDALGLRVITASAA